MIDEFTMKRITKCNLTYPPTKNLSTFAHCIRVGQYGNKQKHDNNNNNDDNNQNGILRIAMNYSACECHDEVA